MLVSTLRGVKAFFADEKQERREQYDAGFSDGSDDEAPESENEHYVDGFQDAVSGRYLPPVI